MLTKLILILNGRSFERSNYAERTHDQLVDDLNDLWAQFRAEKLKRWVVTVALMGLWEIFKLFIFHK